MKTTVFTKYHIAAGAKMAEFAGYNMPIEFTGINDEHLTVRQGAGVFDVSHMGEIWVKGPRALDLLQRITTNDVSKLFDGKVQYKVPEGTQSGTVFRLRGKGIPVLNGRGRGDQYVTVNIETPRNLTKEQKEALRSFSDMLGESNYEKRKSFFSFNKKK